MRQYPQITELEIRDVANRGVANQECILIKPRVLVDISPFALFVGFRSQSRGLVTPVRDLFFWFGEGSVSPDDWICVFSGSGTANRKPIEGAPGHYIFCYWGRPTTLFHDSMYTPFLLRYDAILVAEPPLALPQL